ncbi:MAG TPA: hypothetical protein VK281_03535 [Xanthobacteraceae bacterium]|nr:hypothetical protein [Xanthobacteraceae bacterium]
MGEIDDLAPQSLSVADGTLALTPKSGGTFDPHAAPFGMPLVTDAGGKEKLLYDHRTAGEPGRAQEEIR